MRRASPRTRPAARDGDEARHEGGIDEGSDAGECAEENPVGACGCTACAQCEGEHRDEEKGGEAGLPEDDRQPEDRQRDGPEEAGYVCGGGVEEIAREAHHEPDGREGDEDIEPHDDERGGEGVGAEEKKDGGDKGRITRRDEGSRASGNSEGRAVAQAVDERVGEQAHLPGMRVEPATCADGEVVTKDTTARRSRRATREVHRRRHPETLSAGERGSGVIARIGASLGVHSFCTSKWSSGVVRCTTRVLSAGRRMSFAMLTYAKLELSVCERMTQ